MSKAGNNFWDQIKKTAAGCWLWQGNQSTCGYGVILINKRRFLVHRFAWMWFKGAIPDGMWVLHKCDVPNCVNPEHLFLGTQADNNKDCVHKGRNSRGEKRYNAKLTEWDVREIRRRTDISVVALAKAFLVAESAIYRVRSYGWKHVV